jgi:hypothetical protein
MLVLLIKGNYDVRHLYCFRWQDIHTPNLLKIGTGIQAILRFCLRYLKWCNVGITDGRDLWCMPLKLAQIA